MQVRVPPYLHFSVRTDPRRGQRLYRCNQRHQAEM